MIKYDPKEPVETGLACYYQNAEASAAVASMKGVLDQKVAFAAAGNGSKIEKEPMV